MAHGAHAITGRQHGQEMVFVGSAELENSCHGAALRPAQLIASQGSRVQLPDDVIDGINDRCAWTLGILSGPVVLEK